MSNHGKKLLDLVLRLPEKDRKMLAREIIASLDDASFKVELKRRRDEFLLDPRCAVPWRQIDASYMTGQT
jgi:hypothetical protein